ncbi:MAG: CBASS cGAMP-activated phospholipase [Candidatus Dormibacteria bacterium]
MATSHSTPPTPGANEVRHRFQVLALDGGGVRGLFSAAILARLEEDLHTRLLDHFDLVVGTSTGGLTAVGLGAGMSPQDIVNLYTEMGTTVFPWRPVGGVRRLLRSKYSPEPLRAALEQHLGDMRLEQSSVNLLVTAYDLTSDTIHLFKTPHNPTLYRDGRVRMVDVALATSAAPTYFPAHVVDGARLVDGGIVANNPAVIGIAEAVSMFGRTLDDVHVLSIGTTSDVRHRAKRLDRGGVLQWCSAASDVLLRGQSRSANGLAIHFIGNRLHRIDQDVPQGVLKMDRIDREQLHGRAAHVSREHCHEVGRRFLPHTAARVQPRVSAHEG